MAEQPHSISRRAFTAGAPAAVAALLVRPEPVPTFDPAQFVRDVEWTGHRLTAAVRDGELYALWDAYPDESEPPEQRDIYHAALIRMRADPEGRIKVGHYLMSIGRTYEV